MVFSLAPKASRQPRAPTGGRITVSINGDDDLEREAVAQQSVRRCPDRRAPCAMEARGAPPEADEAQRTPTTIMMIGMQTPTPVKARLPIAGHMSDIDAVYDIVEHVDELGNDGRHSQPHQQPADRLCAQKGLIVIHEFFSLFH